MTCRYQVPTNSCFGASRRKKSRSNSTGRGVFTHIIPICIRWDSLCKEKSECPGLLLGFYGLAYIRFCRAAHPYQVTDEPGSGSAIAQNHTVGVRVSWANLLHEGLSDIRRSAAVGQIKRDSAYLSCAGGARNGRTGGAAAGVQRGGTAGAFNDHALKVQSAAGLGGSVVSGYAH